MNEHRFSRPCTGQEESIYQYLGGELTSDGRDMFLAHLRDCPPCQILLTEVQIIFADLSNLEPVEPPAELVAAVMDELPADRFARQPATLEHLVVVAQLMAGAILLLLTVPRVLAVYAISVPPVPRPYPIISASLASVRWEAVREWAAHLLHTGWSQLSRLPIPHASPEMAMAIGLALAAAWMIANGLLLNRDPHSVQNGGTS